MDWKIIFSIVLAGILLVMPTQALAVDFEISKVLIEAQLNEDGSVDVKEQHTYEFDGEFNGVTRELEPKQGSAISGFTAFENGSQLEVERDENLYKVFRGGDDETIAVELHYKIENAVERFQDGAEFYWPFFDDRNESDYGNMTITVLPPAPAEDVSFVGYDEAFDTASLQEGGAVKFDLGNVLADENGDIRVVFEPELFPALAMQDGTIRNEVENEQIRLEAEQAVFLERQQSANQIGSSALAAVGGILALLFGGAWLQARKSKQKARQQIKGFIVPEERMSMPATLYFTKSSVLPTNTNAAALMELVRKGNVEQVAEDQFELVDRRTDFSHEAILLKLLFDQVGQNSQFKTKELEAYTSTEASADDYQETIASWAQEVAKEVKEHSLYAKKKGIRWFSAIIGAVSIIGAIFFGIYELFFLMALSILFVLASFGFAVFYKPLTPEGRKIREEWKQLELSMADLPEDEWQKLSRDEKVRAYTYLLGTETNSNDKKAQAFAQAETYINRSDDSFVYNPVLLTTVFLAANSNSSAHASSTSSVSTGGGVGGGGGGSGAF